MAFMRLADIVQHYEVAGSEAAPAFVFINSLGTDLRVWDRLHPGLVARFRTVRSDKRGHGLSGLTPGPYSLALLAEDQERLLDRLGVRRAVVCGLSIGGMIAQVVAARRPDLVQALVLMDTAHRIGTAEAWRERLDAVRAGGLEAIADAVMGRWFAAPFHRDRGDELEGWRTMLTRTPAAGYIACGEAIATADLTAATGALALPTLCIVGAQDGSTPPALVAELAGLIPGSRLVVLPDAAHLPCVERPEAVATAIDGFLAENGLG